VGVWTLLRTVYRCTLYNVCFWYGTIDGERINLLAKLAAADPFANFANNRCESSLTPPMIHCERAENEAIFANFAIPFANFANWVMALAPSPAAQTIISCQKEKFAYFTFQKINCPNKLGFIYD
jgi:hypothetical protein